MEAFSIACALSARGRLAGPASSPPAFIRSPNALASPGPSPYIGDNSGGPATNRSTTGKLDGPRARFFMPEEILWPI
jgi:hypothetical protein